MLAHCARAVCCFEECGETLAPLSAGLARLALALATPQHVSEVFEETSTSFCTASELAARLAPALARCADSVAQHSSELYASAVAECGDLSIARLVDYSAQRRWARSSSGLPLAGEGLAHMAEQRYSHHALQHDEAAATALKAARALSKDLLHGVFFFLLKTSGNRAPSLRSEMHTGDLSNFFFFFFFKRGDYFLFFGRGFVLLRVFSSSGLPQAARLGWPARRAGARARSAAATHAAAQTSVRRILVEDSA